MKRAALYLRVSTLDQHPENQRCDLEQLARQRGWTVIGQYCDHGISGARARRPALDQLLADGRRGQFEVVAVWACDRLARSVQHFLEVLDELNHLNIEFVSCREQLDTGGPLGRTVVIIISAIAELERNLIIERVRAGMRRAKLEFSRLIPQCRGCSGSTYTTSAIARLSSAVLYCEQSHRFSDDGHLTNPRLHSESRFRQFERNGDVTSIWASQETRRFERCATPAFSHSYR